MSVFAPILGASILLFSVQAHAVPIGDKDWLQVVDTKWSSWNDFDAVFDTTTGACDVVGCLLNRNNPGDEIQPLVDLTGYIWASNSEVNELFMSYLGGTGLDSLNSNNFKDVGEDGLNSFFDDFHFTSFAPESNDILALAFINGWTRNQSLGESDVGEVMYAWNYLSGPLLQSASPEDKFGLEVDRNTVCVVVDCRAGWPGGWVYKPRTVPEPGTLALFAAGFLGLSIRRKILGGKCLGSLAAMSTESRENLLDRPDLSGTMYAGHTTHCT